MIAFILVCTHILSLVSGLRYASPAREHPILLPLSRLCTVAFIQYAMYTSGSIAIYTRNITARTSSCHHETPPMDQSCWVTLTLYMLPCMRVRACAAASDALARARAHTQARIHTPMHTHTDTHTPNTRLSSRARADIFSELLTKTGVPC